MRHRTVIQFLVFALLGGDIAPVSAPLQVTGNTLSLASSGNPKTMGSPSRWMFRVMAMKWAPAHLIAMKHWGLRAYA